MIAPEPPASSVDKPPAEPEFVLANDPPVAARRRFDDSEYKVQRMLISGLDCLPGQEELFS